MGPVVFSLPAEDGGGGQEAGVAAHNHINLDAGQCPIVEVIAHEGTGDEFGGCAVSRAVVGYQQVVIDGFWDVEGAEIIADFFGHFVDKVAGIGGVVAADVVEILNIVFAEYVEDFSTIFFIGLVPCGAEGGGRRKGQPSEGFDGEFFEVDKVFFDDAGNGMNGTVEIVDFLVLDYFIDYAHQGGVNHACWAAGLSDYCICHRLIPFILNNRF